MARYIDADLINYTPQHFWSDEYGDKYDIITRSEVEKIPTADVQEVKWTPIKERLPEESERHLRAYRGG